MGKRVLPPIAELSLYLRRELEAGCSVRSSLIAFAEMNQDSELMKELLWTLKHQDRTGQWLWSKAWGQNAYRLSFQLLIEEGMSGRPIARSLRDLETELLVACTVSMDRQLSSLPFQALIPLLLFQFPAFLLLLVGPLLRLLTSSLSVSD